MAKRQKALEGAFVKISLGDKKYAYGRILKEPLYAFYDGEAEGDLPLLEIQSKPILFRVWVMNKAVTSGRWEIVGVAPLEEDLKVEPRFFKFDRVGKKLNIYYRQQESPATWEECKDLECAAVWSAEHVEDRLRDCFLGRPNKWVEALKPPTT